MESDKKTACEQVKNEWRAGFAKDDEGDYYADIWELGMYFQAIESDHPSLERWYDRQTGFMTCPKEMETTVNGKKFTVVFEIGD